MAVPLRRYRGELPDIEVVSREEFLRERFDYQPGEHVTIAGPTQRGKTYLGFQLLDSVTSPQLHGVVLASKPRDGTVNAFAKSHKKSWRVVDNWETHPDEWYWNKKKRRGYILRPHQGLVDVAEDDANVSREFKRAIMDSYGSKDARIVFIDEAHQAVNDYKLQKEVGAVLKRGSALDCGGWCLIQRAKHVPYDMYNAPEHLFLFNDPDRTNRERFGQIGGGVDPYLIENATNELGQYQVLYVKRTSPDPVIPGPLLCVIQPQ